MAEIEQIERSFRDKLQFGVYGEMLKENGIKYGDIDPFTLVELEAAEERLANIVARWIKSLEAE